jgi:hypothetical protein
MALTYNPVPRNDFETFLTGKGFEPTTVSTKDGHELVYQRRHHGDAQLIVRIYTSLSPSGVAVRPKGKDAIRVCLVGESDQAREFFSSKTLGVIGLMSAERVNRCGTTESIFKRVLERARELYTEANRMHRGAHCSCGAPCYPDSGKCVLWHVCDTYQAAT